MLDTPELEKIHDFPLTEDSIVWIVGAYGGKTAKHYEERYDPYLYLFEPQAAFAEHLKLMFKGNRKVHVYPFGLRDRTGHWHMAQLGSDAATFLYPTGRDASAEQYPFMDVADWLHFPVDLMHMNCEGGEFEILPRMIDLGLMNLVRYLMVQFHPLIMGTQINDSEKLRLQIDRTHTRITDQGHVWTSWRRNG